MDLITYLPAASQTCGRLEMSESCCQTSSEHMCACYASWGRCKHGHCVGIETS